MAQNIGVQEIRICVQNYTWVMFCTSIIDAAKDGVAITPEGHQEDVLRGRRYNARNGSPEPGQPITYLLLKSDRKLLLALPFFFLANSLNSGSSVVSLSGMNLSGWEITYSATAILFQ